MSTWIEALYEKGAFHPKSPVHVAEGQHVSLHVEPARSGADDLSNVRDLLDDEFIHYCQQQANQAPSLALVRTTLASFHGSLAERIAEERDER